jgi:hypothetical protein
LPTFLPHAAAARAWFTRGWRLQLDPNAPGSHDDEYVYPIGFRTSRKHASATNPGSKCLYHSEIVAGPNGKPQFKVTCQDMSEHPYEDSTPNVCSISPEVRESERERREKRERERKSESE